MKCTFECIDAHTCGNPVRLVKTGKPNLQGHSIFEKRLHFIKEYDWIRRGLMFEPRGHDMMSGCLLYPPHDPNNDFSILFIETSGCLPMCGHGTIGAVTIAIENKLVVPKTPGILKMEAPAGLVEIEYQLMNNKVQWVKLTNVPSFLHQESLPISHPDLGEIVFDVAYGGNFYAIIDPQKGFDGVENYNAAALVHFSQKLRPLINEKYPNAFIHPENPKIKGVSHILWTGKPINPSSSSRNAVFYGDKAIDRSPCGTGTSARMAQLFAKGLLKKGEAFIHESYIGSTFTGRIENEMSIMGKKGIVPSVQGWAKIYGLNTITIDTEDDPFALGFQVL